MEVCFHIISLSIDSRSCSSFFRHVGINAIIIQEMLWIQIADQQIAFKGVTRGFSLQNFT